MVNRHLLVETHVENGRSIVYGNVGSDRYFSNDGSGNFTGLEGYLLILGAGYCKDCKQTCGNYRYYFFHVCYLL